MLIHYSPPRKTNSISARIFYLLCLRKISTAAAEIMRTSLFHSLVSITRLYLNKKTFIILNTLRPQNGRCIDKVY